MEAPAPLPRREFLKHGATAVALALAPSAQAAATAPWRIAPFSFDVTPPIGHTLGGFGGPAVEHRDPLQAIGYALLGPDRPVVMCVVDWMGINNAAHLAWRTALADAAGTTADRVTVHCVHQHDAPFVCLRAHQLVAAEPDLAPMFDLAFHHGCLERGRAAVKQALGTPRRVTHIATSQANVERVASNRRLRDASGRFVWRGSGSRNPAVAALPEGLIDPSLRTLAFYDGAEKVVACHYYATHPMSQYGKGRVSSDFPGLARKRRQAEEPGCTQLYFTGCAGNVAAGKYNDGSEEARNGLIDRLHAAMVAAAASLRPVPLTRVAWRREEVVPDVNPAMIQGALRNLVAGHANNRPYRIRPAMQLAWVERVARGETLGITALWLNDAVVLHLPGEMFVEYQLRAQRLAAGRPVLVAAYGDGGPWYVPVAEEYATGGYEVSVAYNSMAFDARMMAQISKLLA